MPFDDYTALNDAKQAYVDNAGYEENSSSAEAAGFITACRKLLILLPKSAGDRMGQAEFSPEELRRQIESAQSWLAANGAAGGSGGSSVPIVTRAGFNDADR